MHLVQGLGIRLLIQENQDKLGCPWGHVHRPYMIGSLKACSTRNQKPEEIQRQLEVGTHLRLPLLSKYCRVVSIFRKDRILESWDLLVAESCRCSWGSHGDVPIRVTWISHNCHSRTHSIALWDTLGIIGKQILCSKLQILGLELQKHQGWSWHDGKLVVQEGS